MLELCQSAVQGLVAGLMLQRGKGSPFVFDSRVARKAFAPHSAYEADEADEADEGAAVVVVVKEAAFVKSHPKASRAFFTELLRTQHVSCLLLRPRE